MKIHHYCYTRTKYVDYCAFSRPGNLSYSTIKEIQTKVLSITDSIDGNLNIPKWILIKTPDYLLWGVCCLNSILSDQYNCDYSGTPISGMFAIVLTDYQADSKLPYDLEYFRRLYELEVAKFWTEQEPHDNMTQDYLEGNFNYVLGSNNSYTLTLNTDIFKCLSLGSVNKEDVISAALTLDKVSLIIDNDSIDQVTNMNGSFMNCVSSFVPLGSHNVKQRCPRCKKIVTSFTSEGICSTCQADSQISGNTHNTKDDDMVKKLKKELEDANSQIQYLTYDLEEANKKIKKKNLFIKILISLLALTSLAALIL